MHSDSHPQIDTVRQLLDQVAPSLGLHGGSIELVGITPEGVVEIRFAGACIGCAAADYTLEYGIKQLLLLSVPELIDVVAVNTEPVTHQAPTTPLPFHAAR